MPFIRNVRLRPVGGGFEVSYDYLDKGDDEHDDVRFISSPTEVFREGDEAMDRVVTLANSESNLDFFTPEGKEISAPQKDK